MSLARKAICDNCRFFSARVIIHTKRNQKEKTIYGECRYNPPRETENMDRTFPTVLFDDWCRCHENNHLVVENQTHSITFNN